MLHSLVCEDNELKKIVKKVIEDNNFILEWFE